MYDAYVHNPFNQVLATDRQAHAHIAHEKLSLPTSSCFFHPNTSSQKRAPGEYCHAQHFFCLPAVTQHLAPDCKPEGQDISGRHHLHCTKHSLLTY